MSDRHLRRKLRHWVRSAVPGVLAFSGYRMRWLRQDLTAGLSVAAIALPVGIAYADLAGVPAVVGMYSAIFPLFAYALFGSSRQLMTGPDAATCIIVAASLTPLAGGDPERYMTLLTALTFMTGVMYLLAGTARLGFIADFLSQPILTGYLNGIALLIIVGQLPKLFGYPGEADAFLAKIEEVYVRIGDSHPQTLLLGLGMLGLLLLVMRFLPRLPGAFVVVLVSMALVAGLGLQNQGVAVLGDVPGGLPSLGLPSFSYGAFNDIFSAAAGIVLVSFTSGVLTAKSFARRNGYDVDANQELIGFGSCNVASALAQGFPVTGADSRTAVNNAMGGKTQMVGLVAGATMLLVLIFLTSPLAYVPTAALAAVILVSAVGLFDLGELRVLYRMSLREFFMSVATTAGVLVLGVLPGVLLAVVLSLMWLLSVGSRPHDAVLGRVKDQKGFHSLSDYPDAKTIPGLLVYRFDANVVFYNADYFKQRVKAAVEAQKTPVQWLVIDGSAVNVIDVTALRKIDELRQELSDVGVSVYFARVKRNLERFFNPEFVEQRRKASRKRRFQTIKAAVKAYAKYQLHEERKAAKKALASAGPGSIVDGAPVTIAELDPDTVLSSDTDWVEQVQAPRKKKRQPDVLPDQKQMDDSTAAEQLAVDPPALGS